jgi:hypothetical protein
MPSPAAAWENFVSAFVVHASQGDLAQIVLALCATAGLASRLNCRKQERYKDADNRNNDQ